MSEPTSEQPDNADPADIPAAAEFHRTRPRRPRHGGMIPAIATPFDDPASESLE